MSPSPSPRPAYDGHRRKIILAFDVGTTYSGISYSILDPGQCPSIHAVTRFPAQEIIAGASKVPSVIYYDKKGRVKAIGAEAIKDGIHLTATEGDWDKAEWFKLHLRSKYPGDIHLGQDIPPLPPNKTIVDVFADYLHYLLGCAASYIKESHPNGHGLWSSVKNDMYFVLSHPNGWEGKEQSQMRKAAVKARLVPDNPSGQSRISFVTEGEASLHFAIENCVLSQTMEGQGTIIIDAGGGTIDVSTYKRVSDSGKTTFEEISVAQCYFQGSVFVTMRAGDFLKGLLDDSPYLDDLDNISDCFDKTTKTRFRNASEDQFIKFGSMRDNDATCNIRFGQLKLAGSAVAKFFQPSIDCIVQAVMEQKRSARKGISHVVLVGGFAASDYLFERVKAELTKKGLALIRPDNRVNKAVSDGAISFFLDHHVRTRVAKVSYGAYVNVPYNKLDPEHVKRSGSMFKHVDGLPWIGGAFDVVLPKNTQVPETQEFTRSFNTPVADPGLSRIRTGIMCYRGSQKNPKWIDTEPASFTTVCELEADLSQLPKIASWDPAGNMYYTVKYGLVLKFGLTELQAQLRWFEGGVERRSPASLIYDGWNDIKQRHPDLPEGLVQESNMPEKESIDVGWSALTGAMKAVKDAFPSSLVPLNMTLVGILGLIFHVETVYPARPEFFALVNKLKASESYLKQYDETNQPMNEYHLKNLAAINLKVGMLLKRRAISNVLDQDVIDLTSELVTFLEDYFDFRTTLSSNGHVLSVSLSHDGTRIVSGSSDNTVQVRDVETGLELIAPLKGHSDSVSCVSFSRDGTRIVSSSYDKTIRLWDAETGEEIINLKGHTHRVTCVVFSPEGIHIISSSYDKTIRMWDARTGQAKIFNGHTGWVTSVGVSEDGTRIVSGSEDLTVGSWHIRTGEQLMKLVGHTDRVWSVNFSPDRTRIVSGSDDKTIRIWDGTTGDAINVLTGHSGRVTSVLFSSDGARILSGSEDKTIRLWDARTGEEEMKPFEGHRDCVRSVSIWTDGSRILSGSDDKSIRIWNVRTGADVLKEDQMEFEEQSRRDDEMLKAKELEEQLRWHEELRKALELEEEKERAKEQRRLEEMRKAKELEEEKKRAEEQRRREVEMHRAKEREEETNSSDDDDEERPGPDHLSRKPGSTLTPAMPQYLKEVVSTSIHPHILLDDDYIPFVDPRKLTMSILLTESCSSTPTDSSDDDDDDRLDPDHLSSGPSIVPLNPHLKSETSISKLTPAMPQHFVSLAGQQNIPSTSIDTPDKDQHEDTKVGDLVLTSTCSHVLADDNYVPFVDPTKLTTSISLSDSPSSSTPTNSSDDDDSDNGDPV